MKFNQYQTEAEKTINKAMSNNDIIINAALGLAGETGEVVDLIKKWQGQGHTLDEKKVINELGDVLWYISEMCSAMMVPLSEVAEGNIAKLRIRYGEKFDSNKSINRKDDM